MEKIILRKDILGRGYVNSAFINLVSGKRYTSEKELLQKFELKYVMKRLFNEDIEVNHLSQSVLYQKYSQMLATKDKENDKFIEAYQIDDEFALQLGTNIYLYHLVPKHEFYVKMVPWYYSDSRGYYGDTWWESDEDIIKNIKNLSLIEFLKRYKGY